MYRSDEGLSMVKLEESAKGNIAKELSLYKHRKKQAANDAQLLMNRIALLQKEEERANKKIDATKHRANEIIKMRQHHGERLMSYVEQAKEEQHIKMQMQSRNRETELEGRKNRQALASEIYTKRREDAAMLNMEKKSLTKQMLRDQEKEIKEKQRKREEIKRMEEKAKAKREEIKRLQDEKIRKFYAEKASREKKEAAQAEKLVRSLEKKEREWMEKLQRAQMTQESAFEELESALIADVLKNNSLSGSDSFTSNNRSPPSGRAQLTSSGSSRKK